MIDYRYMLPSYPCTEDMWDKLAKETRPIVVYGMGNGADKLIRRFEKYGITVSDFFASDGFVRGHSFHGKRVKSFSEIKSEYSDFVIVLSFATTRDEVLEGLTEIDSSCDMYVPDMPVAGEEEFFDREFYNSNYEKIVEALNLLSDDISREIYSAVIRYKLDGRMSGLLAASVTKDEMYSVIPCESIITVIDAGAYNGDTAREAKHYFHNLKKIYALEPDTRNFKKLVKYSEAEKDIAIKSINAAAWCEDREGVFITSGNRNSTVSATASYEHKETEMSMLRIDGLTKESVDYIKYDVEGAEREALIGSEGIIKSFLPTLLVSVYHRSRDIFSLALMLHKAYPPYNLYLRRLRCLPAWEINLILVDEKHNIK